MSWIDDLALWAAGREDGPRSGAPKLSRRGALAAFGATAAAVATGTLGDPEEAEAIVRCCDPDNNGTWSCPDGDECCCYLIPGGGGHSECCFDGKTCQAQPGQFDHGVQVVACCYQVCAHDCCSTPEEVCNSQGFCFSCGDLEMCGDDCCDVDYECVEGKCTVKCPTGQDSCGDVCCAEDEECFAGGCLTKCAPGAVRCGNDHACCDVGQACENNVCVDCPSPKTKCGDACCGPAETCCDESRSMCCTSPKGCREGIATCACPDNTCICGGDCCGPGEYCDPSDRCLACPSGTEECGGHCCPAGSTCKFPDYSGTTGCKGHCVCSNGGLLCGDKCCNPNDICLEGVCIPCAPTSDACIDHCCQAPFVCTIDTCGCPDGHVACADGCCGPDDECVNGRCLPKCDYAESSGRCGDVCCPPDELCLAGTCSKCAPGTTTCGAICCPAGEVCFAAGICRKPEKAPAKVKTPKTVTVEHGTATLTVTCTGGCSGTVTLETGAAHASLLALMTRKPRRVVLGKAKFKVPAGRKSAKAHVHLSAAGKRYLAKHHGKLKAQALVKTSGRKKAFLSHAFTLKGRKPKR
jgi:hypothetical protein